MKNILIVIVLFHSTTCWGQDSLTILQNELNRLKHENNLLKYTELVQSMSQRSLLTPAYFYELKALIARQAYNFWTEYNGNPLVSHLNVYSALYYANKYLGYDSLNRRSYNQALGHNESVISVKFGKNPNYFYSAGSDGRVLKWDLNDTKQVPELIYKGDHLIRSIDIGINDEWILVVTKDQGIILVNNNPDREALQSEIIREPELVQTAAFIPGESRLLTIARDGTIKIMGVGGTELKGNAGTQVASLTMNAQNQDYYVGTRSGQVQIWEDTLAAKIYLPESFSINTMAVSPDFTLLALGREKGDVILWDLRQKTFFRKISGHQSAITDIDFSADSKLLLTASRDRTVRVWEVYNQQKLPLVLDDHDDWVMTACFDPTAKMIISGSKDNFIRFWPLEHKVLASRICELVTRNMTIEEWNDYVGASESYQNTCENQNPK